MVSEAKKRANAKYNKEHIKRVTLDLQKPIYNELEWYANQTGYSVAGYVKRAIARQMQEDDAMQGFVYRDDVQGE